MSMREWPNCGFILGLSEKILESLGYEREEGYYDWVAEKIDDEDQVFLEDFYARFKKRFKLPVIEVFRFDSEDIIPAEFEPYDAVIVFSRSDVIKEYSPEWIFMNQKLKELGNPTADLESWSFFG